MFVFVYGTLKRGLRLHHHMDDCRFIGEGTLNGYTIHQVKGCWYPGIKKGDGFVKGEVFGIDEQKLKVLDGVEGLGHLYGRAEETVQLEGGDECVAWVYYYINENNLEEKIDSGVWSQP